MARRKTSMMQTLVPDKVRKPSGLKVDGSPNSHWRKFAERLDNFEQVPLEDWKHEEILGYLLKRYRDHFKINFSLSYSGAPGKCGEMYCVNRMLNAIGTEKGWISKQYIDYVYDKIIIPQKVQVDSLGFFFTKKLCDQFRANFAKSQEITRSTELPPEYKGIADKLGVSVATYGDLAFARMALNDTNRDDLKEYSQLFVELEALGFYQRVLDSLPG